MGMNDDKDFRKSKTSIFKESGNETRRLFIPEQYLWEAVLFRAFYDLVGSHPDQAWKWFISGHSQEVIGSFNYICMVLSIENKHRILESARKSYETQQRIFQYPSTRVQHSRREFFINKEKEKMNG